MRNGVRLSENEKSILSTVPYNLIAALVGRDGAADNSGLFTFEAGTVFKVIINIKDMNALMAEQPIALVKTKELLTVPMNQQMMNAVSYKEDLYFIVLANKKSLSLKQVLDFFAKNIFVEGLSGMMNQLVFLESLQVQMVSPKSDNEALPQASYSLRGQLTPELFPTCPRPFVLTQMPAFLTGAKNKYTIRFHGVADGFFDVVNQPSPAFQRGVNHLANFLSQDIICGINNDLILRNCVQTRKSNSPLNYIPTAEITIGSFISNANPQNKKRGVVGVDIEDSSGENKSMA